MASHRRPCARDRRHQCLAHAAVRHPCPELGRGAAETAAGAAPRCCPKSATAARSTAPTEPALFGQPLPIAGIAGDQQAALVGQACFEPGMAKSTYGTGCFLLLNTVSRRRFCKPHADHAGLPHRRAHHLCDGGLDLRRRSGGEVAARRPQDHRQRSQTAALAAAVPDAHGVYMVPAFVGLGAPHWDPNARGLICGLTLDATAATLTRAALESVAYQTLDLTAAMARDGARRAAAIRVDGGMAANDWFCQFLADVLEARVERPAELETTALGTPSRWPCHRGVERSGRHHAHLESPRRNSPRAWTASAARASSRGGARRCGGRSTPAPKRPIGPPGRPRFPCLRRPTSAPGGAPHV